MKIYNYLLYGTWLLRRTNDINLYNGLNYIIIENDNEIKLKTLSTNKFIGIKKSRTAYIKDIITFENKTSIMKLNYSRKNTYTYSFLGIEIPEIKTNSLLYNKEKRFIIYLFEKTLLVIEQNTNVFYIFDLFIGQIKYPNIETNLNTFIFTQLFGIIISLLFTKLH